MIFDTHCHYNLEPLYPDWERYWQEAQAKTVHKAVVVGTSTETSLRAVRIANADQNLWAATAIHPIEFNFLAEQNTSQSKDTAAKDLPAFFVQQIQNFQQQLEELLKSKTKIVAIGETGLDYFHLQKDTTLSAEVQQSIIDAQKLSLTMHIHLAQKYHLPLILHVRDQVEQAYWDTLQALEEASYQGKFVLHCVSGPTAYVQRALEMGGYVSAAGNVTYKNAEHLRDLVRSVPADKILVETDAPYLPPQNFRGQICEPWMISETAAFLDQELAISSDTTWQNAHTFFGLE